MMRQYQRIRASLPADVLLFFRLGDFYELFFDDARIASPILNVTLTKRQDMPMCGVPYHAADHYIAKLVKAGKRVAICEQKGDVLPGKLVEREVTQVLSAGTVTDPRLLEAGRNQFLAAAFHAKGGYGFAYIDLTTGVFRVTELVDAPALLDELGRVSPVEFLISDDASQAGTFQDFSDTRPYDAHAFVFEQADHALREHFGVHSLDGFGCAGLPRAVSAAGGDFSLPPAPDAPSSRTRHFDGELPVRELPCAGRRVANASGNHPCAQRWRHELAQKRSTARSRRSARGNSASGCCTRCATVPRWKHGSNSSLTCSPRRIACA